MYYLGIDISTTASKALLIDEIGKVVAVAASAAYAADTKAAVVGAESAGMVGGSLNQHPRRVGNKQALTAKPLLQLA